jgi:hypothetical protein
MREWISSIGSGQPLCHIEHSIWPKLPLCKLPSTEHHGVQRCIPDVACRYEVNNPRGCPESLYSSLTALRKDSRTLAKESNVVAAAMCEAGGLRKGRLPLTVSRAQLVIPVLSTPVPVYRCI